MNPALRLVGKPAIDPRPFDDWRRFVGSTFYDRYIGVHLDWRLCQHEFYICAYCSRLFAQVDRPTRMWDICWDCFCVETGPSWRRSWLEQIWVQITGAA